MIPLALVAPFLMDFFGLNTKNLIIIGVIAALALGVWLFFKHYEGMKEDLINYEASNKALSEQVFRQQEDIADIQEANQRLSAKSKQIARAKQKLEQDLADLKLAQEAIKNPTVVEQVVNKRSDDRFRCIEIVSGSPLVPADGSNVICPELSGGN